MFYVNIGGSKIAAFENLMHLMNCTAYPGIKTPHINITGKFDLGVHSNKGWSVMEAVKIEWEFIPEIQNKVDFMTSAK